MEHQVTVTHTVSDQYLMDVLTTAVEGGIGYWSAVRDMARNNDSTVKWVQLVDLEDGGEFMVTANIVLNGLQRALNDGLSIDLDDIDAEAADMIVQCGVFGKVVYG